MVRKRDFDVSALGYPIGPGDKRAGLYQGNSSASPRHNNNNNIMAPIHISEKWSLDTGGLALTEDTKPRRSHRPFISFVLTTLLLLAGYHATVPILSACTHRHGKLNVEERASKILSENPLIGIYSSSQSPFFNAYQHYRRSQRPFDYAASSVPQ
jgi:hypothetical protein